MTNSPSLLARLFTAISPTRSSSFSGNSSRSRSLSRPRPAIAGLLSSWSPWPRDRAGQSQEARVIAESTKKTDRLDAQVLAEFLARDMIPEAYMPTPRQRQHRALVRHRQYIRGRMTSVRCKIRRILSRLQQRPQGPLLGPVLAKPTSSRSR